MKYCSKFLIHFLVGVKPPTSPEINHLQRRVRTFVLKQNVLRLEVAVHDVPGMAVDHRGQYLFYEPGCVVFGKVFEGFYSIEQLSSGQELGNKIETLIVLEKFKELDDVGVVQILKNLHF